MPTSSTTKQEVTPANGQPVDASTDYVQALRAARDSRRSGATMKDILHQTVVSHQTISNHTMSAVNSQSLSTALTVMSANIEGLTASKSSILSEICKRERCHCLCLQETHRPTNLSRPKIAGISLVAERPHSKYGSVILISDDLNVENVYERVQGTVELITIVMSGVVVHSVYKPPNDQFALPAHRYVPHIVIGDFNSHNTSWGYDTTYNNGEAVEQWADSCVITLIHDAKLPKSFNSTSWKKGYNSDLIFASGSIANCVRSQ